VLALKKIWRGYGSTALPGGLSTLDSESDFGSITFSLGFPDAQSRPRGRFGYIFHLVDGDLPAGLGFTPDAWSTAMRADSAYPYIDWTDGRDWEQDAFAFRVCITVVDSAGNESLPSNIISVSDDGKQEERKKVKYEQQYLVFSSDDQRQVRWTGTDELGVFVSMNAIWPTSIELNNGTSLIRGNYFMQVGEGPGKPHRIDIYDNIEVGPHIKGLGIYEMSGDSLRLCLAPPGDYRPAAFHQKNGTRVYRLRKTAP
jgi:hypothetical protein